MNIPAPSLYELYDYINVYRDLIEEDEKRCILAYLTDINAQYSGGCYWLKGQLRMLPDEQITEERIQKAIELDTQRMNEYGSPCNAMEFSSVNFHNKKFENLQKVLEKYYESMEEEMLRPPDKSNPNDKGGEFYQQIAKKTLIGK